MKLAYIFSLTSSYPSILVLSNQSCYVRQAVVCFNCLEISVYCMLYERALHLKNCSSLGFLTSCIRSSTHVLTTQTNLIIQDHKQY